MTQLTPANQYSAVSPMRLDQKLGAEQHRRRVRGELTAAGTTVLGRLWPEIRCLHNLVHPGEHIEAVAYGFNDDGASLLVATDRRVLYIDKRPIFLKTDEVTYDVVGGITYGHAGPFTAINLHTRVGDFPMRMVRRDCAHRFINYIEQRCLEHVPPKSDNNWGAS